MFYLIKGQELKVESDEKSMYLPRKKRLNEENVTSRAT